MKFTTKNLVKAFIPYGVLVIAKKLKTKDKVIKREHAKVSCPFCNSNESIPHRMNNDIVKCIICSTVYLRERMTDAEMEKYYNSVDKEEETHSTPVNVEQVLKSPMRREYFMDEILQLIKPEGEMLDIGCAYGAFLLLSKEKGFKPTGIELSISNVDFINKTLGIKAYSSQLVDTKFEPNQFNLITMGHVLEHLPHPKLSLNYINKILKKGGIFCGLVPNIESFCSETLKDNWHWLCPHWHYTHFSVQSITKQLEISGFDVLRVYTATGDYNKDDVFNIFKNHFPEKSNQEINDLITKFNAKNFGEEIRFFATKK